MAVVISLHSAIVEYQIQNTNFFLGKGFTKLTVTFEGKILAEFSSREDAAKAIVIQIAAFWNFNASYQHSPDGKPLPRNVKLFFEFVLFYFLEIRQRYKASTSNQIKMYPIDDELLKFWDEVEACYAALVASRNPQ